MQASRNLEQGAPDQKKDSHHPFVEPFGVGHRAAGSGMTHFSQIGFDQSSNMNDLGFKVHESRVTEF